jgi:hypothetical protein
MIFVATIIVGPKNFSHSSFGAVVRSGIEIRDTHPGSATLPPPTEKGGSKNKDHDDKNELFFFVWCIGEPAPLAFVTTAIA